MSAPRCPVGALGSAVDAIRPQHLNCLQVPVVSCCISIVRVAFLLRDRSELSLHAREADAQHLRIPKVSPVCCSPFSSSCSRQQLAACLVCAVVVRCSVDDAEDEYRGLARASAFRRSSHVAADSLHCACRSLCVSCVGALSCVAKFAKDTGRLPSPRDGRSARQKAAERQSAANLPFARTKQLHPLTLYIRIFYFNQSGRG